jgi:large subunit ribosomal protein L6
MSRIGFQPVVVPTGVSISIDRRRVSVDGPKGSLRLELPPLASAKMVGAELRVERTGDQAASKAMHGLARALLQNMVRGVSEGYSKKLEIQGVGFKASLQGQSVVLVLGYSHSIRYPLPDQIKVTIEDSTKITVEGPDRQVVGQVAADLRGYYPPEPYKGKGVRYQGERVTRKEGKTVQ